MACILLWSSAVKVHDSQAYRKMDVTREPISCILELREILLLIQTGFSLVSAADVCALTMHYTLRLLQPKHSVRAVKMCLSTQLHFALI